MEVVMLRRLRCWLLGCTCDHSYTDPDCHRCGEDYFGTRFYERPLHVRLAGLATAAWRWIWPRCWECKRSLMFRRRHERHFCSRACQNSWLPF